MAEDPYDRIVSDGATVLSDSELVGLLVGSHATGLAVMKAHENLYGICATDPVAMLKSTSVLGERSAYKLAAAIELGRRTVIEKPRRGLPIRHPTQLAMYLQSKIGHEGIEQFGVILLDGRNRLLAEEVLSTGGWSASVVRPREVFRRALLHAAPALILFHNHPSGDPLPSREDIQITNQLVDAGKLLGVKVLDHLIVGSEGYASLRERGLM